MGAGCNITVLCPTIGRTSLEITIRSFLVQRRLAEDRLMLLCDGWDGDVPVEDDSVEVRRLPKRGNWGHDHIYEALNDGVSGDYIVTWNDDDAFLPWAFHVVRPRLRGALVAFPYFVETGAVQGYYFFPKGGPIPLTNGRVATGKIAGLGAFIPNERPFSRFGEKMHSDGDFLRAESMKRDTVLCETPLGLYFAPLAPRDVWEGLGMNEVMEWSPEFVKARPAR